MIHDWCYCDRFRYVPKTDVFSNRYIIIATKIKI